MEQFVKSVTDVFDLGDEPSDVHCAPMVGSSHRLWKLTSSRGCFVLKEFPYDTPHHMERREAAARFEREVFRSGELAMPEPIPSADGAFVVPAAGSRGERSASVSTGGSTAPPLDRRVPIAAETRVPPLR